VTRRAAVVLALAATAACGTTPHAAGPIVYEDHSHTRPASDPTAGLADQLAAAQRPTPERATRGATRPRPQAPARVGPAGGDTTLTVTSTAYCEHGTTASGAPTRPGTAAMNNVPFGTQYLILDGPLAGTQVTVADRYGHSTEFDVWLPDCAAARTYGRHTIHIQKVA
jgi:3D (Asp-Asp-Asp) domain-containing protein